MPCTLEIDISFHASCAAMSMAAQHVHDHAALEVELAICTSPRAMHKQAKLISQVRLTVSS
jgi:hypothetical protein